MNLVLAAGLMALTMQPTAQQGVASGAVLRAQVQSEQRIEGRALKDTPDAVLSKVLADPYTTFEMRSAVRGEIALRTDWRNRPDYGASQFRHW